MKILIVSGFLGAGKTTFIKAMAQATGRDFVVYENEYAGAGIDTARLEESDRLSVFESLENCICCSGKADFASSIITISCSLDPEYLIVEPTGLARLSNLIRNTSQVVYGNIELLAPVAIVDAQAYWLHRQRYPDIYEDQVKNASTLVISKLGGASSEDAAELVRELRADNPEAEIIAEDWKNLDEGFFRSLLSRSQNGKAASGPEQEGQGEPMERLTLTDVSLPTPTHLIAFLNALAYGDCGAVTRAKGCLPCGKEWLQFDLVENSWEMTGSEKQKRSECVFIGPEIRRNEIRKMLQEEIFVSFPSQAEKSVRTAASKSPVIQKRDLRKQERKTD